MNTNSSMDELERRATDALRALLGQVSVIKLKEIRHSPKGPLLARVDVLGHSHTLACEIQNNPGPDSLRQALETLRNKAAHDDTTPVVIAPHLSPEEQAVCKERAASFLDLEGNARLAVGEVFIGKRSQPAKSARRSAEQPAMPQVRRPIPPGRTLPPARSRSLMA